MSALVFHVLTFDSLYNKELIQYLISLYGVGYISQLLYHQTRKRIHIDLFNLKVH